MTVEELHKHLSNEIAKGNGGLKVCFNPEEGEHKMVEGGIAATTHLMLADIKLDKVGGF